MIISDHLGYWAKSEKVPEIHVKVLVEREMKAVKQLDKKHRTKLLLQQIDAANKTSPLPKEASCRAGCSFCCHQGIYVTDEEVQLVLDEIEKANIEIDLKKLEKQSKFTKNDYYSATNEESSCVLLKDNRCQVYNARPAACRNYFVTSDPKYCENKYRPKPPIKIGVNSKGHILSSAIYSLSKTKGGILAQKLWRAIK